MRHRTLCSFLAGVLVTLAMALPWATAEQAVPAIAEQFNGPVLDERIWQVTRQGDVQESTIDIVDGRLRLRMATIGTRDETVKFQGVRTREAFDLSQGLAISFELDWNEQANGCYLTAGIYLCPTATDKNPRDEKDWLKVEYVGVPPGKNARALVDAHRTGNLQQLFTEGWPQKQREGRKIARQRVRIVLQGPLLQLGENGKLLFETRERQPQFERAYLYLQMSSHSNYPAREVFFDDVRVEVMPGTR